MKKQEEITFIVIQMFIEKEEFVGNNKNIAMGNIVRVVGATSKAEAIGKFIIDTASIKCIKKLDVECYGLGEIRRIG